MLKILFKFGMIEQAEKGYKNFNFLKYCLYEFSITRATTLPQKVNLNCERFCNV